MLRETTWERSEAQNTEALRPKVPGSIRLLPWPFGVYSPRAPRRWAHRGAGPADGLPVVGLPPALLPLLSPAAPPSRRLASFGRASGLRVSSSGVVGDDSFLNDETNQGSTADRVQHGCTLHPTFRVGLTTANATPSRSSVW